MFGFGLIRLAFRLVVLLVMAIVIYFAATLVQVWLTSLQYGPRQAQAIVVMGAAQYNGVPSPDLQARLDEALSLYQEGYAKIIAVTGNKEKADTYTEAETGARFLEGKGVPSSAIVQAGGNDSWANLAEVAPLLKAKGATMVLIVTDPFHEDRSMAIATNVGLTPYPTPTQTSPITGTHTVPYFLKEAFGVSLGRIIGYQRLHALG